MYQTLYRKYRPKFFSDVVGQDIIIKVLKNSIKNSKIAHAYLFIGPRGTGKTSTAKIFARAVSCSNPKNGDLCDKCDKCEDSRSNDCLDILEIDAASNNGVDEIRNLKEKVNLVPNSLKYKVYIIDEVHMLTIQAFNALLKTLEEPPEHVIFILATTDPQKVPDTIVSRCQCFNFNRLSEDSIVKNLMMISKKENIKIDEEVLKEIAIVSDGGMRDSIGMLDKLSMYSDNEIKIDDFLKLNGLVTKKELNDFVGLLLKNDLAVVINTLEKWNNLGNNIIQIMIQLLNYLKDVIVDFYINNKNLNIDSYLKIANLINDKLNDIRKSSNPKIYVEILLLKLMEEMKENDKIISREIISEKILSEQSVKKDNVNIDNSTILEKNDELEKENVVVEKKDEQLNTIETKSKNNNIVNSNIKDIMEVRVNNAFVDATKDKLNEVKLNFDKLNDYTFDNNYGYLVCNLLDGNLRLASDKYVVISYEYSSIVMDNLENISDMEKVVNDKLDLNIKLAIITDEEWNNKTKEYVNNKKNNVVYKYIDEPKLMFVDVNKDEKNEDINSNLDAFSDILEVE